MKGKVVNTKPFGVPVPAFMARGIRPDHRGAAMDRALAKPTTEKPNTLPMYAGAPNKHGLPIQ